MGKTHWKNLGNYEYLGAYSLDGKADEIVLTIKDLKKEEVTAEGGNKDVCIVAYFEEKEVSGVEIKPMVLNATNCGRIEKMYSQYYEDWIGKKITVYVAKTKFQRDLVPCLRIREEKPKVEVQSKGRFCSVCGQEIEEKIYQASIKKYGKPYCSKECLEKSQEKENKGGNE